MICLVASQSYSSIAAIVFFTCIWIPFLQLKRALLRVVGMLSLAYDGDEQASLISGTESSLPVGRFVDLQCCKDGKNNGEMILEESCSICLVEFDEEDLVSKLSKCGHVFHLDCIESWVNRSQFTCPLCRSFLFNVKPSHAKCYTTHGLFSNTPSYFAFSWH